MIKDKERVTLHRAEGGRVARLHGEMDLSNCRDFEEALLDALVGGSGYFAVDLDNLTFMDSQGIHMLCRLQDSAAELYRCVAVLLNTTVSYPGHGGRNVDVSGRLEHDHGRLDLGGIVERRPLRVLVQIGVLYGIASEKGGHQHVSEQCPTPL